jgi:hypothetical protein
MNTERSFHGISRKELDVLTVVKVSLQCITNCKFQTGNITDGWHAVASVFDRNYRYKTLKDSIIVKYLSVLYRKELFVVPPYKFLRPLCWYCWINDVSL